MSHIDIVTQYFHIYVAANDYFGSSGILTFSAGAQSNVTILLRNDEVLESTESFFVDLRLLDTNNTVCDTATVIILDNEPTTSPPTTPPPTTPRMLTLNTNSKLS